MGHGKEGLPGIEETEMLWLQVELKLKELKCTCTQKIFFDMWKGHNLEVHYINI